MIGITQVGRLAAYLGYQCKQLESKPTLQGEEEGGGEVEVGGEKLEENPGRGDMKEKN